MGVYELRMWQPDAYIRYSPDAAAETDGGSRTMGSADERFETIGPLA
jgi:hypothetical protein